MGDDTAAQRLAGLLAYFREHPTTGPVEGHTPTATASAPLSLATLDHITASVAEVVAHTRQVNPAAGPVPAQAAAVYDWCRKNTETCDELQAQRRERIIYRQSLEHAIRAGDVKVVRPHRCPKCRTFGLMWVPEWQRALCTNTECVDKDGLSHSFTLARLAYEHVSSRKNLRQASAT